MTLTELRYLVNLDKERHFGHAAERSFVSQPRSYSPEEVSRERL